MPPPNDTAGMTAPQLASYYSEDRHYNSLSEVTRDQYLFTEDEWKNIVKAYNKGDNGGVRLRFIYDSTMYIGNIEARVHQEAEEASSSLEKVQALAKRYSQDIVARPGHYGMKVAKACAKAAIIAAATASGVGLGYVAVAGIALDSDDHIKVLKQAENDYNAGEYKNALIRLSSIGFGVGGRVLGVEGFGKLSYTTTAARMATGSKYSKMKTL